MFKSKFALIIGLSFFLMTACGTLSSKTYIDSGQSFVLGKNKHRGYTAKIQNVGNEIVEVYLISENGAQTTLGAIAVNEKVKYNVPENCTIQFKSKSDKNEAVIKIRAIGDTNLSMSYN